MLASCSAGAFALVVKGFGFRVVSFVIWAEAHLLGNHGHGGALVQQPQLAGLVLRVRWVAVDSPVQHRAVEVAHLQRPAGKDI